MKQAFVFSQTAQSALLAKATLRTESKGTVLFQRGDLSFGVFLLRKGSVGLQLQSRGKAIWDRTVTPGAVIGMPATLSGGHYSLTASTLEKSELAFVDCQALLELMSSNPGIGVEVVHALGEEVVQTRELLAATPNGHHKRTSKTLRSGTRLESSLAKSRGTRPTSQNGAFELLYRRRNYHAYIQKALRPDLSKGRK